MNRLEFLEKRKRACRCKVVGSKKIGTRELLRRMNEKVKFYYPCNGGLRYLGSAEFNGDYIIKIKLVKDEEKRKNVFNFIAKSIVPNVIGIGESIIGKDNYENITESNNVYECMMGPIEYYDRDGDECDKESSSYIKFIPKSFKKIHTLVNRINIPITYVDIKDFDGGRISNLDELNRIKNNKKFLDTIKCYESEKKYITDKDNKIERFCKHSDLHDNNNKSNF